MMVPGDYVLADYDENHDFMWLRKISDKTLNNILIHKAPYVDSTQLSLTGMKAIRDTLGLHYVSSDKERSYMKIDDINLPLFHDFTKINDNHAGRLRGVWMMENDIMGGPFTSYAILDQKRNEVIFIDAFAFAPGELKRDIMQQLDFVLTTTSTP